MTSYVDLQKRSKQLSDQIRRVKPDCFYIHLGINDVMEKKAGIVSYVEDLASHLLDATRAQICFSFLIPSCNDSKLNKRIDVVNEDIREYVSWLHYNKPRSKERIFTFSNKRIGDLNFYSPNTGFKLRERGQKLLWLQLREGLRKTMRLPRSHNNGNSLRLSHSPNRFSHD